MDKCNCTIEKFPKRPALSRRVSNYSYNCECISGFRLQKFPELFNRNTYWCNYSVTLSFTHSYLYSLLLSILHLCMHQLLYSLTHQFYHNWIKNPKNWVLFFCYSFTISLWYVPVLFYHLVQQPLHSSKCVPVWLWWGHFKMCEIGSLEDET